MEISDWLLTISMVMHFARTLWDYVEKRNDKTNERIAELSKQVEELEREVAALRTESAGAPSHADLAKVYESINTLAATVNLAEEFVARERALGGQIPLEGNASAPRRWLVDRFADEIAVGLGGAFAAARAGTG